MKNKLVITSDGSHTIYVPELNEHYHSVNGAVGESLVVYIKNGYEHSVADPVNILEIGFGTGLNALLTLVRSTNERKRVYYTAIEKYPLRNTFISKLNHFTFAGTDGPEMSKLLHSAEWDKPVMLTPLFTLMKIKTDFISADIPGLYDLVYYDAFGPDKQPEMWTDNLINKVSGATVPGGIFVTYSAKGSVKRALKSSGFEIELLPGPPGKREVLRAVKKR